MTRAGFSMLRLWDNSYREAGEHQAAHGAPQDHGVPYAQSSPRNQEPARVTRKRRPARVPSASQPCRRAVASRPLAHQARPKQAQP
jgi:hypothetical protein